MSENLSDESIVAKLKDDFTKSSAEKSPNYITETISLPSKGYFYPEDHPLTNGEIELKYPSAREEDILTSRSLIQKGVVIDRFIKAIIVTPVDYDTILLGDKNAIMVASRILAYNELYLLDKYTCPNCGTVNEKVEVDLTTVGVKEIDFSKYTKGQQEFELELKGIKGDVQHNIKFKILTHGDSKKIDEELKALKKKSNADREMTTRLKYAVIEVDGNRDRSFISNFTNNLLSRHSLLLRKSLREVSPDVELEFDFKCKECGYNEVVPIPIEASFFWPSGRL